MRSTTKNTDNENAPVKLSSSDPVKAPSAHKARGIPFYYYNVGFGDDWRCGKSCAFVSFDREPRRVFLAPGPSTLPRPHSSPYCSCMASGVSIFASHGVRAAPCANFLSALDVFESRPSFAASFAPRAPNAPQTNDYFHLEPVMDIYLQLSGKLVHTIFGKASLSLEKIAEVSSFPCPFSPLFFA